MSAAPGVRVRVRRAGPRLRPAVAPRNVALLEIEERRRVIALRERRGHRDRPVGVAVDQRCGVREQHAIRDRGGRKARAAHRERELAVDVLIEPEPSRLVFDELHQRGGRHRLRDGREHEERVGGDGLLLRDVRVAVALGPLDAAAADHRHRGARHVRRLHVLREERIDRRRVDGGERSVGAARASARTGRSRRPVRVVARSFTVAPAIVDLVVARTGAVLRVVLRDAGGTARLQHREKKHTHPHPSHTHRCKSAARGAPLGADVDLVTSRHLDG